MIIKLSQGDTKLTQKAIFYQQIEGKSYPKNIVLHQNTVSNRLLQLI